MYDTSNFISTLSLFSEMQVFYVIYFVYVLNHPIYSRKFSQILVSSRRVMSLPDHICLMMSAGGKVRRIIHILQSTKEFEKYKRRVEDKKNKETEER